MTSRKAPSFYTGVLACVLTITAVACYDVVFLGIEYREQVFDIRIYVILMAVGILTIVLLLTREWTADSAPTLLRLGSDVALVLFINIAIWPVSDTIYGIEPFPQITQLMVCVALITAALMVGETTLYLRKYWPA